MKDSLHARIAAHIYVTVIFVCMVCRALIPMILEIYRLSAVGLPETETGMLVKRCTLDMDFAISSVETRHDIRARR